MSRSLSTALKIWLLINNEDANFKNFAAIFNIKGTQMEI